MASAQNQGPNVDLFDAYFLRADLDRDGRISGSEAVGFFQGSGLPKQVLAQVWAIANQSQSGFLGRAEFYNALKLVTVAQSKRDLTPEIVKAALYGPASAKIPAPQINLTATAAPQLNSTVAAPRPQIGAVPPMSSLNVAIRGPQVPPNVVMNQQHFPSQGSQLLRPPQVLPSGGAVSGPRPPNSSSSSGWVGGTTGAASLGAASQVSASGIGPSTTRDEFGLAASGSNAALPPRPQETSGMKPSGTPAKDSKGLNISGNGFSSDSIFGGDVFSATPSQSKQDSSAHTTSAGNLQVSSIVVPVSAGTQPSIRPNAFDSLQGSLTMQPVGGQLQQARSHENQNQKVSTQTTTASNSSGISLGAESSASSQSQLAWPRMTQTDVQKYTKVFIEVDRDRDGKITGGEARNLFLSWRLPREILKQVWDLSDQDNDSMLSLGEFCIALYLMERYREGRPLPAVLPSNIMFSLTPGQSVTNYTNTTWRPPSGPQQQHGIPGSGARNITAVAARPPRPPVAVPQAEGSEANLQKSKVPVLEKHLVNQLSKEEQNSLNSKFEEATEADKKVEELEKELLESRQKIEFYRVKMQELVLYKSRCDNRLNEIIERTSADKREVESLAKKYEDKYKQVGDVASKLTLGEATFRDLQEKKMELYQAIVKMEQDGSADGVLQVRADHIQSDLDELVKALNGRCKKYGLHAKPATLTELPFGWQPGIQEGAADWDQDWDKFEDEGFTSVKELTLDVQNVIAPPREKFKSARDEKASTIESPTAAASPSDDTKSEKPQIMNEHGVENGSAYNKGEDDFAKSTPISPVARSAIESPPREFPDFNFDKAMDADASPRDKDYQSDHGGAGSVFSGDKSFDEPTWGTFDANDDVDSVWGLNPVSTSKGTDQERNGENYFFGSGDFGLNPIRTESPQAGGGFFQKKSAFSFDDSVPSTPLFSSGNSPHYYEASGPSFDSFSRFDSFSSHDTGFLAPRETLARFDSVRSSRDNDQGHGFPSFDDSDPFGSEPFRTSLESQTPKRTLDNWSAF
ncbi:epidermal growth factor receptor substrate 15-like 1 isoform X1 [Juglans regia]|uniref:Epidermal growth factor receptor substrate 15-like 1 isoform X1 n=2 Tax=Juglans regia TaxID=51240 RepID=A0A6P9E8U7_JUGRE|nr:epidermal growth factor receptor substrate 15-like 1 isoform X1 [Juglans regia]